MRRAELCALARDMADTLQHRGPDDAGTWVDEEIGVGFGFRRLAILDLTQAGHQPQLSKNGRFVLAFNGEIYNHTELREELESLPAAPVWAGHSDTETLLAAIAAWGVRLTLERANGMFAIAVWDREERCLSLARDRFGEKPLYFGWSDGAFIFGSELKALRRYCRFNNPIDRDVLKLYMQYSCVPAPYSIYKRIYKVEPGCLMSLPLHAAAHVRDRALWAPISDDGIDVQRFWSITKVAEMGLADPIADESEAVEQLGHVLSDAVRIQSIADVPLGAFLSGGIDSSTIVALMQAHNPGRVRTFTIGFDEVGFNEAEHAKAVAQHLRTEHVELYVSPQQARDIVPKLPELYSEPFADSSQIPTHIVSQMARRHVTVALSGDGGDELFGGYTRHTWGPRLWQQLQRVPIFARRPLGAAIQCVPAAFWDVLGNVSSAVTNVSQLGHKAHRLAHRLKHVNDIDELYRELVTVWPARSDIVIGARPLRTLLDEGQTSSISDSAHRMMLWDALTYLSDDILHKVDRASMGVSLETRAPFLDRRVAEFAWRIPLHMKIRGATGKWIVRQLLYRHVPRELIDRPKTGFGVPINSWIRGPLREWAEDLLSESRLNADGYFNPSAIRKKWHEHLSGSHDWTHELWCALMFQSWLRRQEGYGASA